MEAANKVLNSKKFTKEQEKALTKGKKSKQIAAANILKKTTKVLKNQRKHIW